MTKIYMLLFDIHISQKIFEAFASRKGIAVASLNFRLDGDRVTGEQTPKMLELEENDQIDVNLQMVRFLALVLWKFTTTQIISLCPLVCTFLTFL